MKKFVAIFAAMMVSAFATGTVLAADFTPSVEGKDSPDIITVVVDGEEIPAEDLVITPVSDRDDASEEISDRLEDAYEQIETVTILDELVPQINEVVDQIPGLEVDDLVVRDLFDISASEQIEEMLQNGQSITICFDLGISADEFVMGIQNLVGTEWDIVQVRNRGNGAACVTIEHTGPLAIIVAKDSESIQDDTVPLANFEESIDTIAPTGIDSRTSLGVLGVSLVVAVGAAVALKVKKR